MNRRLRFDASCPKAWLQLARRADYQASVMVERTGVKAPQLRRLCRQFWGASLESWLRDHRLQAARLLVAEGKPVGRVAGKLGFRSATHFSRVFRLTYGQSPRSFARTLLKRSV